MTPVILRKGAVGSLKSNLVHLTQQFHWYEPSATKALGDATFWKFNIDAKDDGVKKAAHLNNLLILGIRYPCQIERCTLMYIRYIC